MKYHIISIIVAILTSFFILPAHAQSWGRLSKVAKSVQKNEYIVKGAAARGAIDTAKRTHQPGSTATAKPGDEVQGNMWPVYGFTVLAAAVLGILYLGGIMGDDSSFSSSHPLTTRYHAPANPAPTPPCCLNAPTRAYVELPNGGGIMYL